MIKDRDVRDALRTLEDEFENAEAVIKEKDDEIEELAKEVQSLKDQVEEYESRISELEEALAEAYLTSEVNDEQIILNSGHPREIGSSKETVDGTGNQSQS
jgi:predicted  nucleic acid-binding Zn-ribbon protein